MISDPKYRNVRLKETKPSAAGMSWVLSSWSYMRCSRSVWSRLGSLDFFFFIILGMLNCWLFDLQSHIGMKGLSGSGT